MPSENQHNSSDASHENEAYRILKSGMNPRPMIRGIEDYDRALQYHRAAHDLDCNRAIKEVIAEKLRALEE